MGALILAAPWIMNVLLSFTEEIFTSMIIAGAGG
jgi:flagellar biosynthesis protein FliQ